MMMTMMMANQPQLQATNQLPAVKNLIEAQQKAQQTATSVDEMKTVFELNKVVVHLAQNDGAAATAALEKAGDSVGDSAAALLAKGMALKAQNKWTEAIKVLRAALARDDKLIGAWFALGHCLDRRVLMENVRADFDSAKAAYAKVIELDSTVATPHYNLGVLLYRVSKDVDGAEAEYRKAIKLDPTHAAAYNNLAMLLQDDRNDYAGAEAAYRKGIEFEPTDYCSHFNLGQLYMERKRFQPAEEAFRKAIQLNPKYVPAHVSLGQLLQNTQKYQLAVKSYRQAINLEPNHKIAQQRLAMLEMQAARSPPSYGQVSASLPKPKFGFFGF